MKVEITKTQLESIITLRNDIESMIGCSDGYEGKVWERNVKNIDIFLKKNELYYKIMEKELKEINYDELILIIEKDLNIDLLGLNVREIHEITNREFKFKKCKICEGDGWYSQGFRYTYKNYYCVL